MVDDKNNLDRRRDIVSHLIFVCLKRLQVFLKGCQHEIAVALSLKKMFFKVYRLLVGLKKRLEYLNYSCVCALNSWPIPCVLTIVEGAFLFEGQQQHGVVKV